MSYRLSPQLGMGTCIGPFENPGYRGSCAQGLGCGCNKGMGLFDSGFDISTWSIGEWSIVGIAVYAVLSMFFTTSRAVGRVRALPGERRKRRAAALRTEASELTKKKKGLFD